MRGCSKTSMQERAWAWSDITSSLSERPPMTVSFTMKPATSTAFGTGSVPLRGTTSPRRSSSPRFAEKSRTIAGGGTPPRHNGHTEVPAEFPTHSRKPLSHALSDGAGWESAFATASSARRSSQALESALGSCCSESSARLQAQSRSATHRSIRSLGNLVLALRTELECGTGTRPQRS